MPDSSFTVVLLPAPLGPMYPTSSPRRTVKETSSTAVTSRWRRRTTPASAPSMPALRSATRKRLVRPAARMWISEADDELIDFS